MSVPHIIAHQNFAIFVQIGYSEGFSPVSALIYSDSITHCSQSKAPRMLPIGKFLLLPIPQWPWSHIAKYFVTDLQCSQGNTATMMVINSFSKSLCQIPLADLPSAFKMTEFIFTHVIWHYAIPKNIVSDKRAQFTSLLWSSFKEAGRISIPAGQQQSRLRGCHHGSLYMCQHAGELC